MWKDEFLKLDRPGSIRFTGSQTAELFTEEVKQSMDGVLSKNYDFSDQNAGFISASVDGRPWEGTMWSRDAGTFLRELVFWGYIGRAGLTARQLIRLCAQNKEGFYTFPEKFEPGIPAYGMEIDGTASVLVGFSMLVRKLNQIGTDFARCILEEMMTFINLPESPLAFLLKEAEQKTLLSGTGEFGGGLFVEGSYCNVVQNMLVVDAIICWEKTFEELHDSGSAVRCKRAANRLEENIRKYLVLDGKFVWCVDPEQLIPPEDVLGASGNVGFSGINGVGAMVCDAFTQKELEGWWGREAAINTFFQLLESPQRKKQYQKYGMYLQFEDFCEGMLTSPSYGQGYAIQLALSMGLKKEAGRMLEYLVSHTYHPHCGYNLHRDSAYWFYERMLSPDYFGLPKERQTVTEGCGALNVVNVAEPLKIARMIAGVNDINGSDPSPILVEGIEGIQIHDWAINVDGKLQYQDFEIALHS